MSLENLVVHNTSRSVVINVGMALQVPFMSQDGNGVADVSAGTLRKLISQQTTCERNYYMAPEIVQSQDFDGNAVHLWGVGVILFIMLVGVPPFEIADQDDSQYRQITRGGLEQMLLSWGRQVSPEAADLMQGMLMEDPRRRLTLFEIKEHPWVLDEVPTVEMMVPDAPMEGWRY